MKKIKRKKHLEMRIQSIPPHPKPKVELEQYATPSVIASDLLWNAFSLGDIENKNIVDLIRLTLRQAVAGFPVAVPFPPSARPHSQPLLPRVLSASGSLERRKA